MAEQEIDLRVLKNNYYEDTPLESGERFFATNHPFGHLELRVFKDQQAFHFDAYFHRFYDGQCGSIYRMAPTFDNIEKVLPEVWKDLFKKKKALLLDIRKCFAKVTGVWCDVNMEPNGCFLFRVPSFVPSASSEVIKTFLNSPYIHVHEVSYPKIKDRFSDCNLIIEISELKQGGLVKDLIDLLEGSFRNNPPPQQVHTSEKSRHKKKKHGG